MRVITFNPPWSGHDWKKQTWAYIAGNSVQARALAYYSGRDIPVNLMPHTIPDMGTLTVITGNGSPSKALQIEMRESDLADFCRSYLERYEKEHDNA